MSQIQLNLSRPLVGERSNAIERRENLSKSKVFIILVILLLMTQMFSPKLGTLAVSGKTNSDTDAKVDVKSIDHNTDTIKWLVTIETSGDSEQEAETKIAFSEGQTHDEIKQAKEVKVEKSNKGYTVTTPAGDNTYNLEISTKITDDSKQTFALAAKTEYAGKSDEAMTQVEIEAPENREQETAEEDEAPAQDGNKESETENEADESEKSNQENDEGKTEDDNVVKNEKNTDPNEDLNSENSDQELMNTHVLGPLPNITPKSLHLFDEGNVEIDKKAKSTGKFLEWEIELNVEGEDIKQETYDIVLVFDRSNSMSSGRRASSAKEAARLFVDNLLDGTTDNIRIGIVPFGSNTDGNSLYGRTDLTRNAQTLKNRIDNIRIGQNYSDGGTHISAGLASAKSMLSSSSADHKIIVLLSDGAPTYSYRAHDYDKPYSGWSDGSSRYDYILKNFQQTVGNGTTGNTPSYNLGRYSCGFLCSDYEVKVRDHFIPTMSHARQEIMNSGIGVYTIGFEISGSSNANARYTLLNSQNLGYYNADVDNISEIFNAISSGIKHAATGAYVIDEIGDMFDFVNGSINTSHGKDATYDPNTRQITWNIGSVKEVDGTYTLKYKVVLDCTKNPVIGKSYSTNNFATLFYKDPDGVNQTKNFPKPQVKANTGMISKIGYRVNVDGEPIDSDGNVVSIEEAQRFYTEVFGENLTPNRTYSVPAGTTPDGFQLHVGEEPTEVFLTKVCHVVPFGYVKISELPAGEITVKYVDEDGNEIAESKVLNGNIGDSYDESPIDIDGYEYLKLHDDSAPASGTFTHEAQTVIFVYKQLKGKIKLIKVDADDEMKRLQGAKFKVIKSNQTFDELETDENGEDISIELPPGTYTLNEIEAPYGYEVASNENFNVDVKAGKTAEIIIKNRQIKGQIHIEKVDAEDTTIKLEGATFELRDSEDNLIGEATTDNLGKASFLDLPVGKYYLIETKAPEGYSRITKPIEVEISKGSKVVTRTIENSKQGWDIPATGGIGTLGFYMTGILLMISAAWFVIRRRIVS